MSTFTLPKPERLWQRRQAAVLTPLMDRRNTPWKVFAKYVLIGDGCWEWTGCTTKGYATVTIAYQVLRPHRLFYEMFVGPIPDGLTLDHLCRNTTCVRPWHLEPVTNVENVMRGESPAARAARSDECSQGHALTEDNVLWYRGWRFCRSCKRERDHRNYLKRKAA